MKQEGLERYQDLDRRIGAGVAPAATPDNSSAGGAPSRRRWCCGWGRSCQPTPAASSEPGDPAKEKLYYDAAFDLIKAKDFDKASQAFTAFLRKYPNSQYAGNAQYWLGEVNLAKGDLQGAGQAFAKVSQLYPKHAKVPDSLYKLADVERRLGHTDKVKGILQQVVAQYPGRPLPSWPNGICNACKRCLPSRRNPRLSRVFSLESTPFYETRFLGSTRWRGLLKCLTEADSLFSCYARGDYARHITNYRSFLLVAG
jgi:tol-pal system protein YbgF